MTPEAKEMLEIIDKATESGKLVSVTFIKVDGSHRTMLCRPAWRTYRGKTGHGTNYDTAAHDKLVVVDIVAYNKQYAEWKKSNTGEPDDLAVDHFTKCSFRTINLDQVLTIQGNGATLYQRK